MCWSEFYQEQCAFIGRMNGMNILAIAQDLLYTATNQNNIPSRQFSLGMMVHQATRFKKIMQLSRDTGVFMSYYQVF